MKNKIDLISRRELKFTIDKNSLPKFYSWLFNQKNILPIYQPRKINSIYFDDIFFKSATDNLSGVEKRKKYRIRWYGNKANTPINFELKQKINQYTKKFILKTNFLFSEIKVDNFLSLNSPIANKYKESIIKLVGANYLEPVIETSYLRNYYMCDGVRLTFDNDLNYRFLKTNEIIKDTHSVFEIKFEDKDIEKIKYLTRNLDFIISRHSKYLKGLYNFNIIDYF